MVEGTVPLPVALDPPTTGARVVLDDAAGTPFEVTIPSGAYDAVAKVGWKTAMRATGPVWTWVDRRQVLPLGIYRLVIADRSGRAPGLVRVTVAGKNARFVAFPPALPLAVTAVLTGTTAPTGRCIAAAFPGPAPAPACSVTPTGSTEKVTCK
jgi:hypothetical protein